MKRVLQHSKTGLFLRNDGGFDLQPTEACVCPNLAAAMLLCARFKLNPTEFVYRLLEPEALPISAEFYTPRRAA